MNTLHDLFAAALHLFGAVWPVLGLLFIALCLALIGLMLGELIEAGRPPKDPRWQLKGIRRRRH